MTHGGHHVTRQQFEENLTAKLGDHGFAADIGPLLAFGHEWNMEAMADTVTRQLIARLPE